MWLIFMPSFFLAAKVSTSTSHFFSASTAFRLFNTSADFDMLFLLLSDSL